jgi:hypothetical protein
MKNENHPITCSICLETYNMKKRPLILVCGHTFCEVCLQNMFDSVSEIQCCFCKVVTKLDHFEDMIVNYAILSLVEQKFPAINCENTHLSNIDNVNKLLECIDCQKHLCSNCIDTHKQHKVTSLEDFIEKETVNLLDFLKNYRDLANKMNGLLKKIDKHELERIVKVEKEKVTNFFKDLKGVLDKNQEMVIHSLDRVLKDSYTSIDNFKKEMKFLNSDSNRYCNIVEELSNFKSMNNKQKCKILNIYNVNKTFKEIKEFNREVTSKNNKILNLEMFMKNFNNLVKSSCLYRNKMITFHSLIQKKLSIKLEEGYSLNFFSAKKIKTKVK